MIKLQNKNKLKILIVVSDLEKGGVQRASVNFAKGFKSLGCDAKLFAYNSCGIRKKDLIEENIDFFVSQSKENKIKIKKWRPNLIFIQSNGAPKFLFEFILFIRNEIKEAKIFEKNVFSKPSPWEDLIDASFQMSYWGKWRYIKRYWGNKKKVYVVPNAVDVKRFSPCNKSLVSNLKTELGLPHQDIILGRVGQLYPSKWSLLLIDLFENIKEEFEHISLLLVNPPKEIIRRVNQSIYSKNIVIIDEIHDDQKLSNVYSTIDIFILIADIGESFGNVIAESLLCETPVITLSTPWADNAQCEVVGNLNGGLIASSPKGVLKGIRFLIKDIDLRNELGKKGRNKVLKNYDSKIVCQDILNIYKNIEKPLIKRDPTSEIIKSYLNVIDKTNIISIFFIRFPSFVKLTRVSSGYQTLTNFIKMEISLLPRKFKKLINLIKGN